MGRKAWTRPRWWKEGGTIEEVKTDKCGQREECLGEHFWDEERGTHKKQAMQKLGGQLENFRFEFVLPIMAQ